MVGEEQSWAEGHIEPSRRTKVYQAGLGQKNKLNATSCKPSRSASCLCSVANLNVFLTHAMQLNAT